MSYQLSTTARVTIVLRNATNAVVKELVSDAEQSAGYQSFSWDGTNTASKPEPDGVYTYTITAKGQTGPPATATGEIGIDRSLPGTVTTPTSGAMLSGTQEFAFTPTSGETVTSVYFYAHCSYYPYTCYVASSSTPASDGTFVAVGSVEGLTPGANEIQTYVSFTDAFGQGHSYSAPALPVTIHASGQLPTLSVSANPPSGRAPLPTTFTIEASQPEEHPLKYSINFGDASAEESGAVPSSGMLTVKHTYAHAGVERAAISVFDEQGDVAETTVTVTVSAAEGEVPVDELAPTISGTTVEGEMLTESRGVWSGAPTSYELEWLRCNREGGQCEFTGITTQTYKLTKADLAHTLVVRETARNESGPGTPALSDHTAVVTIPKPALISSPTIEGSAVQGDTLTEHHGEWTNEPTSFTYAWMRCNAAGEGCKDIEGASGASYKVTGLDVGHRLTVQETAHNAGGESELASAKPTTVIVASSGVPRNTNPPLVAGSPEVGATVAASGGSWTDEPTQFGYKWLRCASNDTGCAPIANADNGTYVVATEDIGHVLEVEETATDETGPSEPATSGPTGVVVGPSLRAVAGENITTTAGTAVRLDGTGSSPADEISKYEWAFGDGATATGAVVEHAYGEPGTYTATLTVSRSGETSSQSVTVTVGERPVHAVTIAVQSSGGQPISGADVLYIGPSGVRIEGVTGGKGTASVAGLPDGTDTVYAYAPGYQPAVGQVSVSGGVGRATIALASGQVVSATLTSHELKPKEIEEAGINPHEAGNEEVWEFEARLAFIESEQPPLEFHCYINKLSEFVGGCGGGGGDGGEGGWGGIGGGGGGGAGGPSCSPHACVGSGVVAVPAMVNEHPLIEWLILRGKVTVLKQFSAVTMLVQNLSDKPFSLAHGKATLTLPAGVSLAPTAEPQSASVAMPDIPGEGSASTTWIVRGDEPGEYYLSANYDSQLEPFHAPVEVLASLATPFHVWGAEAFELSVRADSGTLVEGVPYHVIVSVKNVADIPFYNLDLSIDSDVHANFDFQPDEYFDDEVPELGPGKTLTSHTYILVPDANSVSGFNPALSSIAFDGEERHPGQNVETMMPPPLNELESQKHTANRVHLHWASVPGAEAYEVFDTDELNIAFPAAPISVATTREGPASRTKLGPSATDAYIPGSKGEPEKFFAVSAIIHGQPTLELPVVKGIVGNNACAPIKGGFGKKLLGKAECIGEELKTIAECAVSIISWRWPGKWIKEAREAKSVEALLRIVPGSLQTTARLVWTFLHDEPLAGAPAGFRTASQIYDKVTKVTSIYELFQILPKIEQAYDTKQFNQIVKDLEAIAGVKPCFEILDNVKNG